MKNLQRTSKYFQVEKGELYPVVNAYEKFWPKRDQKIRVFKERKRKSSYDRKAEKLLDSMGVTMETKFLYYGPHSDENNDNRDIYRITFKRKVNGNVRELTIPKYGQSIINSGNQIYKVLNWKDYPSSFNEQYYSLEGVAPTEYCVLAGITKYEPSAIYEDFADEFGYDRDSRKGFEVHQGVLKEWREVSRFFTNEELEQLQEVQ